MNGPMDQMRGLDVPARRPGDISTKDGSTAAETPLLLAAAASAASAAAAPPRVPFHRWTPRAGSSDSLVYSLDLEAYLSYTRVLYGQTLVMRDEIDELIPGWQVCFNNNA